MTIKLFFKHGDTGTELNLMAGDSGFQLAGSGWAPNVANPVYFGEPSPILESMKLLLKSTSHDDMAGDMQALHQMQVWAEGYIKDPHQEDPVWLHAKMDNETGERRVLVRGITVKYKTSWFGSSATNLDVPLVIAFVRQPYWESITVRNLPDGAPSAAASVTYDYTAAGDVVAAHDIVGDIGARIRLLDIKNDFNLHRYWMGIRSAGKHGSTGVTNFVNVWEVEDGSPGTDVTETAEGTASGGIMDVVSESALDWDTSTFWRVFLLGLGSVTANKADQFGNFLWLIRAKVTSGTWEIRLKFEPFSLRDTIELDIIEVSDADWGYYEMGIQPIGFRNLHAILDTDFSKSDEGQAFTVSAWARRTSGSGDLHIDCLCPIPIDEGFIKIEGTANETGEHVLFGHGPEGIKGTFAYDDDTAGVASQGYSIKGIHNFALPPGSGHIICVYSQKDGGADVLTNTIIFNDGDAGRYYERWLSLRGSE